MTTNLITRKLNYFFTLYDRNKNGVLEKEDFQVMAADYAQTTGFTQGSKEYQGIFDREMQIWDNVIKYCDKDGDSKITLDEYVQGFQDWMKEPTFDAYLKDYGAFVFDSMDTDHSGKIELNEFLAFAYAQDKDQGTQAFNQLDTDNSGYLSRDELLTAWRDFFFTDDPNSPSNHLFGFTG